VNRVAICHNKNEHTGEVGHFYERDGVLYPSVTTILSAESPPESRVVIERWKKRTKNWKTVQKNSQVVGTVSHFRVLNGLSDMTLELPDIPMSEYPRDLGKFVDIVEYLWNASGMPERLGYPRYIESTLISDRYMFAGKPDLRCPIKNDDGEFELAIVDLKTSPQVYDSHIYQLAAYGIMMEESPEHQQFPEAGYVVNLCPYKAKNPHYIPQVSRFESSALRDYSIRFIQMAENYHERVTSRAQEH